MDPLHAPRRSTASMAGMLIFAFRPDFGRTFCPDWMPIDSLPAAFCTSTSGSKLSSPVIVTLNLSPRSSVTSNGPSTSTAVKSLASTLREAATPEPAKPARPQPPTGTIATAVRKEAMHRFIVHLLRIGADRIVASSSTTNGILRASLLPQRAVSPTGAASVPIATFRSVAAVALIEINVVSDAREGQVLLPARPLDVARCSQGLCLDRLAWRFVVEQCFAENTAVHLVRWEAQQVQDRRCDVGVAARQFVHEVLLEIWTCGDQGVVHVVAAEGGMVSLSG